MSKGDVLTDEEILAIVRQARLGATELKLAGLTLIRCHCGTRMRKVKVYVTGTEAWASHVCRKCGYHYNSGEYRTALVL